MALDISYTPPLTGESFMNSDKKMRVLMGPVGSGKSVTCSFEIIRRASMQKPEDILGLVPAGGVWAVHAHNQDIFL